MVEFLNCFEVPTGHEDEFLQLWKTVNAYMIAKPGYVSHRLHRSLTDQARFRFINHAQWESADDWRNAHDAGFRALLSGPEWQQFSSIPALYDVVHEGSKS